MWAEKEGWRGKEVRGCGRLRVLSAGMTRTAARKWEQTRTMDCEILSNGKLGRCLKQLDHLHGILGQALTTSIFRLEIMCKG